MVEPIEEPADEFTRPPSDLEKRVARLHLGFERKIRMAQRRRAILVRAFVVVPLLASYFVLPGPEIVRWSAVGVTLLGIAVGVRSEGLRAASAPTFEGIVERNTARVTRVRARAVVEIVERGDEGPMWVFEIGEEEVLFLGGRITPRRRGSRTRTSRSLAWSLVANLSDPSW